MVPDRVAHEKPHTDTWSLFEHDASCKQCTFCIDVVFFLVLESAQESDHLCLSSRDVAAAPQTPQLGGAQANFGGPS